MDQAADQRLVEAVQTGDEFAAGRALAEGANPNTVAGRPPGSVLIEAARNGSLGIVKMLIDAGASVGPAGRFNVSPLRVAVLEANTEVAQYLVAHGALDLEPATRSSVLSEAISMTKYRPRPAAIATLRVLLDAGAMPRPQEESPLISAVMAPVAPVVLRMLLECGADAGQRRSDGTQAIVIAARRGDHAAVDVLLQAGADVDATDSNGRTALMHAAERNEQRVISALLLAGCTVDTVSADGMTPLQLARGWHRQNGELMLGQMHAGMDDVPITRTTVRIAPASARLAGDPSMLHMLARVVDIALGDLGDDEWETRTGIDADTARGAATLLRERTQSPINASWHEVDATADELAAIRSALVEIAYGTTRTTPEGTCRLEIVDLLEELDRQLSR